MLHIFDEEQSVYGNMFLGSGPSAIQLLQYKHETLYS